MKQEASETKEEKRRTERFEEARSLVASHQEERQANVRCQFDSFVLLDKPASLLLIL
jgi:hypothetical protein